LPLLSGKLVLAVVCLLNLYKMLFLLSYKAIDAIFKGVMIPITKPCSIAVLVSAFIIALLRFGYPQLVPLVFLSLLINKYSNSIIIITNYYPHITKTS